MKRRALLAALPALAACQGVAPAPAAPAAPAPDAAAVLQRIAFASCTDQTRPQPIWDAVRAWQPDLLVLAGDNVYASDPPWSRERLEAAYARQAAVPEFRRLREAVPTLAIWDDHDYGLNDGGAEFPHKQASKEAFLAAWQVGADDERRGRDGIHFARRFGPPGRRVQLIGLDTRWFRSPWKPTDQRGAPGKERYLPDADPGKTMLGAAQWQWLEERLRDDADVRIIVSGIQVLADGHGWERWGNLPLERQRLVDLIGRTGARGVVFVSGDRHVGALYRQTHGVPYALHEITASGITHPWQAAAEPGPNRLGELVTETHFGTIEFDWAARRLILALRTGSGEVRRQHSVGLDGLRPH